MQPDRHRRVLRPHDARRTARQPGDLAFNDVNRLDNPVIAVGSRTAAQNSGVWSTQVTRQPAPLAAAGRNRPARAEAPLIRHPRPDDTPRDYPTLAAGVYI